MRKYPRNGALGRPLGAAARRRRWLSTELQKRRRIRHAQHVPVSGLRLGLHSFYEPQPGLTHCRSWGETETLPTNPLEGMAWPVAVAGSPGYAAGHQVFYWLFPFRESGAQRVYAGQMRESGWITGDGINPFRIQWPAWSGAGWLTGVTILQTRMDLSVKGWREVSAATLQAGWVDDGSGWDYSGLPHGWSNPLPVARGLWCVPAAGAAVETMPVVSSGLGGWAFDSSAGRLLARVGDDELMRDLEGTTAYWVNMDMGTGEQLSRLGSIMSVESEVYFTSESGLFEVWDEGAGSALDELGWDDWFLVVHRMDFTTERLTPILMTASCAGLALLPLVVWGNIPGHEIEFPMAVVILGGLMTSTLLDLFLLPSLYARFASKPTH